MRGLWRLRGLALWALVLVALYVHNGAHPH